MKVLKISPEYRKIIENYFNEHFIADKSGFVITEVIMEKKSLVISRKALCAYLREEGYVEHRIYRENREGVKKQQRAWIGFRLKNDSERI